MHTVLVIGGYGFFGARISGALAKNPAIRLLIGGRSSDRARRMALELGVSRDQGVSIDAESPGLEQTLKELRVDTVVHTAGPFQGQNYTVARSAINAACIGDIRERSEQSISRRGTIICHQ
jgi:saccharopine dehydrogenase-like NADP-dependent oxidoreductase